MISDSVVVSGRRDFRQNDKEFPRMSVLHDAVGEMSPIIEVEHSSRRLIVQPRTLRKGSISPPHRHRYGQLIYAISGLLILRSSRGIWMVPNGRGVWVPPLMEHSLEVLADSEMRCAYLDDDLSHRVRGRCSVVAVIPLLRELILYVADSTAPLEEAIESSLGTLISAIIDKANTSALEIPAPKEPGLLTIFRKLVEKPGDNRTCSEWADAVGTTERSMCRHLKKETGMTFRIWRQQIRLLMSLEKLAKGEPVTNVAMDVGYNTTSAFITAFRQTFGITPNIYFRET
jgi:AraC-like DNA-binding protein/quercetin dioxygenase-like cupin family protein